jgi:predicted transcriptional regulator
MSDKRAMTLTLSEVEMKALDELCAKKDATKTAIIRQAIRLYHLVDAKLADGAKLLVQEQDTKSELMVL